MTKVNFLSRSESEAVHTASLEVLEKTGVSVQNESAVKLLCANGATASSGRVQIPSSLVEEMLKKVPSSVVLYSQNGKNRYEVGENRVLFNPASSSIYFRDGETGQIRKATSDDLVRFVKVVDGLDCIEAQSTAMVPSDVPVSISDLYRLYIILKESRKPVITGAFTKEGLLEMRKLLASVAGGDRQLANKPRAVFDCCPLSVLIWGDVSTQNLIDCSAYGLPAAIVPAPLMGATSPITLGGTLVQANAEVLSGIVIAQLTNSGCSLIYGSATSVLDQRHGTSRIGAPEAAIVACASAEMGRFYGMPTQAYLGVSDSMTVDAQSGYESAVGLVLGAMAGINIISGPGMLASINCQSLEKLVLDNEVCRAAYRLVEGISIEDLSALLDLVDSVGPGGQYLSKQHTRDNLTKEHAIPSEVISRLSREKWMQEGARDSASLAREQVAKILDDHRAKPLSDDRAAQLDSTMREILETHGIPMSTLPLGV
ncbi:MAG: trimethylamine methyltransferase family protein [Candidatus Hermodarchaeota archaeon]